MNLMRVCGILHSVTMCVDECALQSFLLRHVDVDYSEEPMVQAWRHFQKSGSSAGRLSYARLKLPWYL